MKKLIPFLIVFLFIFYILPLIIKISPILLAVAPILILIVAPILVSITALIYGALFGFNILLSVFCAVLFIPFLIINGFAFAVYLVAFFICSLIGNALGLLFKKKD